MRPFVDSTDLVIDGAALGRRMQRDGYLFIRGLLPSAAVADLRRQFLEIAAEGGWLKPGRPIADAIAEPDAACVDPEEANLKVLRRQYVLEDLHALKHHPAIVGLFERIFGAEVLVHPLVIARNIFPQRPEFTTPAHQDYVHIQGTPETFAVWIPLSDCPIAMGGLRIAAGSHRAGVREFRVSSGAGGLEVTDPLDGHWVASDFALGDVVIFHSMAVHQGLPNRSDRLRQSIDARYQRAAEPVVELSLTPYASMFTWEEVYADWRSSALKFYWRKQSIQVVPYDPQYYQRRDELAFAMAERGERAARAALLRIQQRDRDPAKRQQASRVLATLDAARR